MGGGKREAWQQRLAAERERNMAVLREYQARGLFPVNDVVSGRAVPIFVDRRNTACAVGYLMLRSGASQAVDAIVQANNLVYVTDVSEGPLVKWVLTSGLTQEEAALIQPSYSPVDIEWTPVDQLADEPRTLENLRFSSFALSATPDPDLPDGATIAPPESIHIGVGPDAWGNRPEVSDEFAERYPRLAGVAVLTELPYWWEFRREAWLLSTNSAVSGHAIAHEFRVEPDGFQSLGEVGTEVVLSTQEGGRILVTTRIFGADDELLGTLLIDTDDPDNFSQGPQSYIYRPLQPLPFEPATSLRISTTIQAWGDAAFGWIVYGFGPAGPPITYRLVDGTVEITGFVDGLGGDVMIPSEIGGHPVTRIGDRAFLGADEIVSITLPYTVTSIGRYAIRRLRQSHQGGPARPTHPDRARRVGGLPQPPEHHHPGRCQ